jgi:hypothetical protein
MENYFSDMTTAELEAAVADLKQTVQRIEVMLEGTDPLECINEAIQTLAIRGKLVAAIERYLIDCKEFQPGYHDGDHLAPPEPSWEEFCLVNGKEDDSEVDL